ncbi:hypothetical protein, partial [Pseudomonas aeruginosa]|uniref:hypothetical protein n=1 Tax=Pseudomonas aeruginosa TaxID=287 RepID=UPI003F525ED5
SIACSIEISPATKSARPVRLDTLFDPNQRSAVIVKRSIHGSGAICYRRPIAPTGELLCVGLD